MEILDGATASPARPDYILINSDGNSEGWGIRKDKVAMVHCIVELAPRRDPGGLNYSLPYADLLRVYLYEDDGNELEHFDIQNISNQAGWVHTKAGTEQAKSDILEWCGISAAAVATTPVPPFLGASAALTHVADTTTSTQLLAANATRVEAIITNTSSGILNITVGGSAPSATNSTARLAQYGVFVHDSTGLEIRGAWETDPNNGGANITEITQ